MLVEFSVENLLSFKENSSFSMVAGKERLKKNHVNGDHLKKYLL